jgi:thioredoxin 1
VDGVGGEKWVKFKYMNVFPKSGVAYVKRNHCGVCSALFPKVEYFLKNHFPDIPFHVIQAEDNKEILGQNLILAVPAILIFHEGKEVFRSTGLLSMHILEEKIREYF